MLLLWIFFCNHEGSQLRLSETLLQFWMPYHEITLFCYKSLIVAQRKGLFGFSEQPHALKLTQIESRTLSIGKLL
jgi:hypothetical protein